MSKVNMSNKFYVIWECRCGYVNRWKWIKEDRKFLERGEILECSKCFGYSKITHVLASLPRVDLISAVPIGVLTPNDTFSVLTS